MCLRSSGGTCALRFPGLFRETGLKQYERSPQSDAATLRRPAAVVRHRSDILDNGHFEPGGDLRLTIDHKPRYRTEDLTLTKSMDGRALLDEGCTILEVKVQGAMPLWLSAALSEGNVFKSSFSKYGEAYKMEAARSNETTIIFVAPHIISVA